MRRQLAASALCLGVAAAGLAAPGPAWPAAGSPTPAPAAETPTPGQALEVALGVLGDEASAPDGFPEAETDATLVLRDLAVALPRLTGTERDRAEALLARPTDGNRDPYGDGYAVRSRRDCTRHVCLHWVSRTRDAPPSGRWVHTTQDVLESVWRKEVGQMGFRPPRPDNRGGNRKLDVYLKELGGQGLYGYCAPEPARTGRRAPGYCVLDDDYARSQFGRKPIESLRVTAAHEFLHAVQYGYDYREATWLLEGTATWIEEQYADAVNDNRQFLGSGQFGRPDLPLDSHNDLEAYGNWVFFEYLGQRFGTQIVRQVWEQAGEARGDGGASSVAAVVRALPAAETFGATYADYATALRTPAESFDEGAAWGAATFAYSRTLGADDARGATPALDHLSSRAFRLLPADDLAPDSQLRVSVDGPATAAALSADVVRLLPDGTLERSTIELGADGIGTTSVPFTQDETDAVHVVLVNASPDEDDQSVQLDVEVVPAP